VGRVADGVAARVDRLRALGNGQVPMAAAVAWQILMEQSS
jgi:DNA (cytosine-5)-methyltransferase 1